MKECLNSLNNLLVGLHGYISFMETTARQKNEDTTYYGPVKELVGRANEVASELMQYIYDQPPPIPSVLHEGEGGTLKQSLSESLTKPLRPAETPAVLDVDHVKKQTDALPLPPSFSTKKSSITPPRQFTPLPQMPSSMPPPPRSPRIGEPPSPTTGTTALAYQDDEPQFSPPSSPQPVREYPDLENLEIINREGNRGLILLVDDEEHLLYIASRMLASEGFAIIVCEEVFEALHIYETVGNYIDLVVLDYSMPVMNGEDVYYELTEIRKDAKVVLSSGIFEQEVISRLLKKGLRAFLPKPYKKETLIQTIVAAMAEKTENGKTAAAG